MPDWLVLPSGLGFSGGLFCSSGQSSGVLAGCFPEPLTDSRDMMSTTFAASASALSIEGRNNESPLTTEGP